MRGAIKFIILFDSIYQKSTDIVYSLTYHNKLAWYAYEQLVNEEGGPFRHFLGIHCWRAMDRERKFQMLETDKVVRHI